MEEALQAAELKGTNLEKVKNRMNGELEDLMIDLEKVTYFVVMLLLKCILQRSSVVVQWCNPLTLQPEKSGGVTSIPCKAPPLASYFL